MLPPRSTYSQFRLGRDLHVALQRLRDRAPLGCLAHRLLEVFGADPRHVTLDGQLGEAHLVAATDLGIEPDPAVTSRLRGAALRPCSSNASAIEKQEACAAASSSSGEVSELSPPVRAFHVMGTSASWPLLLPGDAAAAVGQPALPVGLRLVNRLGMLAHRCCLSLSVAMGHPCPWPDANPRICVTLPDE